ncbi:hypothetical protein C5167_025732 [Papaver somniferum]|uniref:Uncharacterized protein n=1 Tax=Papaver somniferum TaxID=3469 RepID=A0A4Y7JWA1_PAPSO|nr:hypothetical protein C5167_025732 [Papaver somniferum]
MGTKNMLVQVNGSEVLCMGSWQDDDGGEWNEHDSVIKTQLVFMILISGSGSGGHGSEKMSTPASCSVGDESGEMSARASGLATDSSYPLYCVTFMSVSFLKNKFEKINAGSLRQLLLRDGSKIVAMSLVVGRVIIFVPLQVLQLLSQHRWRHRVVAQDVDGFNVLSISPWCGISSYWRETYLIVAGGARESMAYPYFLQLYMKKNYKRSTTGVL